MKKLILIILCLAITSLASADELKTKGYIKADPLRGGNNFLIYDKDGKATGRISPDPFRPSSSSHYLIYDKKATKQGSELNMGSNENENGGNLFARMIIGGNSDILMARLQWIWMGKFRDVLKICS